jgi:hypothetical protein
MSKDALVLLNGRDKMMKKIYDFQSNNLTEKQQYKLQQKLNKLQQKLNDTEYYFIQFFKKLAYSFYGLSREQLADFDANELKELADLLARRARPWAICQMLFTFCVPGIGWAIGLEGWFDRKFSSWHYLHYRRYLKRTLGEKNHLLFLKEVLK